MPQQPLEILAAARRQLFAALGLLLVFAGTLSLLEALARNVRLQRWIEAPSVAIVCEKQTQWDHRGYFIDFADRLLLDELPHADYAQGGVYLLGSSNLMWATQFWNLPPGQQALIHNYGIASTNHSKQFQFLRHLVEHDGLLRAGGENTLIILGVGFLEAGNAPDVEGYFGSLFRRHGFFNYSLAEGIHPTGVTYVGRLVETERNRLAGFRRALLDSSVKRFYRSRGDTATPRTHDAEEYIRYFSNVMGDNWQEKLRAQIAEFARMLRYLREKGAAVAVVLLPCGSWSAQVPYQAFYAERIAEVCRSTQIPLYDWSAALNDADFADSSHLNMAGAEKVTRMFLKIALPHLRKTGAQR